MSSILCASGSITNNFSELLANNGSRKAVRTLLEICCIPVKEWITRCERLDDSPDALFQIKMEGEDYQLIVPIFSLEGVQARLTRENEPWDAMADGSDEVFALVTDLMLVYRGEMPLDDVRKKYPQKEKDLY